MAFTATPVDGSSTPIPMSSVVPDGTNTPLPVEGGPGISTGGNTLAPVSIYEKDGNNVVLGATSDAAVVGDVAGTISAKQRGLSKILNDIWDSVNHRFHVNVDNANANGQTTMANSSPVAIASDQSAVKTKGDSLEVTSLSAGALNADLVASTDVSGYKWWSLHINTNAYVGTLTFQGSNDNTNFVSTFGETNASAGGVSTTTTATNTIISGPVLFRYLRIRMTAWTSGAAQGVLELYTVPPPPISMIASSVQSGTWTMQPGNTANTTPWLIAHANNNASVPTGAANTVIKGTPGALATIVVTTAGTGTGNVQIFDNATTNSGTVLFAFPATVSVAQFYQIYGWAKVGMTAQNVLNGPVFTVFYA